MRISLFLLCVVAASLLGACGTSAPPTPAATLPTATSALPAQPALPRPSPTPDLGPQLDAARRQADDKNFEDALDVLVPLAELHPERPDIANLLAAVYDQGGSHLLGSATGQPVAIQDAYLMFSKGLDANPTDEELRKRLQMNKNMAALLFHLAQHLERLTALGQNQAPQEEKLRLANAIYELLRQLQPSYAEYLTALPSDQLLATAEVYESAGKALHNHNEARPLFEKGKDICMWVERSTTAEAPDHARASQCRERFDLLANPPPTPTPRPAPTPRPTTPADSAKRLRFVRANVNDEPTCISVGIRGISTSGWTFRVDGIEGVAMFDGAGNARICNVGHRQEVTISVYNNQGQPIPGGRGVPAIGGAIMVADWR